MTDYVLIDDNAQQTGGTELTLSALFENKNAVKIVPCASLNTQLIHDCQDSIFILGNITGLYINPQFFDIIELLKQIKYVKIEFDYNFCPYRCEYAHLKFGKEQCRCPYETAPTKYTILYETIQKTAKHIFFMSENQRAIYSQHIPIMHWEKTSILSSCFHTSSLEFFRLNRDKPKNNKYAILDGYSTWHKEAKGQKQAIEFCNINNIEYDILPQQQYKEHIYLFSSYKGLVFLPIIHDTCPRCVIEAKLLNMDTIVNYNVQHTRESWWKSVSEVESYISSRPSYFWSILESIQS